ncbi:hypothetical protein CR513_45769, partial [Mucuna pruriens]
MDPAQRNYTTTKKELLEIVLALKKFRSYLLDSKVIAFSNHATLKFLLKKLDAKDKKGTENSVADHLSRIEREIDPMPIQDDFPDEQPLEIDKSQPWYIIRKSIPDHEIQSVLHFCHSTAGGGHYGSTRTAQKVRECRFYWPSIFRDARWFVLAYKECQ